MFLNKFKSIKDKFKSIEELFRRPAYSVAPFILLGLFLGFLVSIFFLAQPQLGIITISGTVVGQKITDDIVRMLTYANENNRIKGVVVVIDSPGGEAAAIEEIYLNMLALKKKKPVVASIGSRALSGGYYMAVAANYIYSKPTSQVGSVGVWLALPKPRELEERVIPSGPFKGIGGPLRHWVGSLDMVKQGFLQAVITQRGEHLKIDAYELSEAKIYLGTEAVKLGIVDKIGTIKDAERKAADLAGIWNYQLIDINRELDIRPPFGGAFFAEIIAEAELRELPAGLSPIFYYLYIEQR